MSTVNTSALRRATSTPDLIAESLREEILRGELAPGQALRQEELAARRTGWTAPAPKHTRGVLAKYSRLVGSAARGAVCD